ncbi:Qat anti-phage system associated protein QatB [Pedobacter nutrimenti]|uniref:Uncharacterized protein n=1 Tax=Pedobacter nutrimenti TaxID=1241337 RepID=A0A318UFA5_9SPHI|nr:Qat anti-phage system associated protein QatB [Pedobacter nutrimenti]PYF70584.1 hypothetical protein B0O44_10810 [Pedobacter nutrimenti]
MGTSSPSSGASGSNPLIPSWIPDLAPGPAPTPPDQEQPTPPEQDTPNPDNGPEPPTPPADDNVPTNSPPPNTNRFRQPKVDFNNFVRSGGNNQQAFKDAVRGYSKSASGNTRVMARRMQPSVIRVVDFYNAINKVKNEGLDASLQTFNLTSYQGRSALEILSALSDEIFRDHANAFDNTQDDAITKLAYANTVTRICDIENLDLNTLTNEQVEVMLAIFIEETIAQRVICDLGNKMTALESDITVLLEVENNAYQIISGLVRNTIMPEIVATQLGDKADLNKQIENIYRSAFDTLGGINN